MLEMKSGFSVRIISSSHETSCIYLLLSLHDCVCCASDFWFLNQLDTESGAPLWQNPILGIASDSTGFARVWLWCVWTWRCIIDDRIMKRSVRWVNVTIRRFRLQRRSHPEDVCSHQITGLTFDPYGHYRPHSGWGPGHREEWSLSVCF